MRTFGSRKSTPRRQRRGLSTVELAVCLPVITLIVFASIEACSMVFLQQSLQTTAYETARFAVAPRSVSATALDRGDQILADRRVKSATIELDPVDMEATDEGTLVVARVSAPLDANRLLPRFFYGNQQLTAEVTMMRE